MPSTFENFDFSRVTGEHAAQIKSLPNLTALYSRQNIAFIGPPGVGKTHLSMAYGNSCCHKGLKAYFIKATEVTCSHHLNLWFWSGGFLLNGSTESSIYKLSSRAPRFFARTRAYFFLIVRIRTVYAARTLLASSRMLIAAFRSLSISFPHVQR